MNQSNTKNQAQKPFPTEAFLELVAARFRLLGDPLRLKIIHRLFAGEASVGLLAEELGATTANTSRHLNLLAQAGLIARRREAQTIFYRIGDPSLATLCAHVCQGVAGQQQGRLQELGLSIDNR